MQSKEEARIEMAQDLRAEAVRIRHLATMPTADKSADQHLLTLAEKLERQAQDLETA